ncbi:RagB/SusD family nutrient uptake outer membrane protein [Mucilaginibacter paludis]|uniref:RagB/SusD domain-containing protein n=1 Tax=Mucilaginibacter paludis DSM 18603 TaxID=714943 RepID=H1YGG2_9SPHI|nr:RagB/SusD family nutrient uptake outer membrane protein [Mucilaginibacter paludis]EHQ24514.1 RagB/SusD domain-containing protein [Mucilaginibacter paludis DSM 18603]
MKLKYIIVKKRILSVILLVSFAFASCEKFVATDIAPTLVVVDDIYKTDGSATAAVLAMYSYSNTTALLGYSSYLGGLDADELQYTGSTATLLEFAASNVSSANSTSESYLWTYPYYIIGQANLAIDGLTKSTTITTALKNQLLGEAKFFRAFAFFHLVNYFGGVPLSLSATQIDNAYLPRATADAVWAQIIVDLKDAQALLPTAYAGTIAQKARVNKWAATAFLARVYLYNKDYINAEAQATQVISSGTYSLDALSNVFINTSNETILQFNTIYGYSTFGPNYRTTSSAANVQPPVLVLYPTFTKSFEAGDNRKTNWVDSTTFNAIKYYRINKYKLLTGVATNPGNEFNVVLRLAEQYLIRAEARAQQLNISGAQADLNMVRNRAGLANTTAATQGPLLTAIAAERKVELFGELGHRWFDLKRTGQADAVIGALKPTTWKSTAVLLPIPYNQIILNKNLTQNPGYSN